MNTTVEKRETETGWYEVGTIEHEGKYYSAGGSYKIIDKGKETYLLYVTEKELTTWGGDVIAGNYRIENRWKSNFGDKRCHITAWIEGKKFSGILYSEERNQSIIMREVRR